MKFLSSGRGISTGSTLFRGSISYEMCVWRIPNSLRKGNTRGKAALKLRYTQQPEANDSCCFRRLDVLRELPHNEHVRFSQ